MTELIRHFRLYRVFRAGLTIFLAVWRYAWLSSRARVRWLRPSAAAWDRAHGRTGLALRNLATGLGGAFVKVGQLLGARADFFPEVFLAPLRDLHDRVPPRPLSRLTRHLERGLGAPVAEVFDSFEEEPLAAASLAQVHRARRKDGREVAVKIQYPEARKLFPVDLKSLRLAVRVVRWFNKNLDLRPLAGEIARFVNMELDFEREAESTERVRLALEQSGLDFARAPEVHRDLSSERILVLDFIEGVATSDVPRLRSEGHDLSEVARRVARLYAWMIFDYGFFHGDPHPGNILVEPDGKIALLDFGLAKELPDGFAAGVAKMIVAGIAGNGKEVVTAARSIGFGVPEESDPEAFVVAIKLLLGDYGGADRLVDALKSGPFAEVPSHFALIVRSFILLNGLSHSLVPGERVIPIEMGRALMPLLVQGGGAGVPAAAAATPPAQ